MTGSFLSRVESAGYPVRRRRTPRIPGTAPSRSRTLGRHEPGARDVA
ncbi:hypothetical protein ACFPN7_10615 [Amycolatopsis halotolerans]